MKDKESVMKITSSKNFVEGFWDINNKTNIIKNKYENKFKFLKELKEKNIDDIVAMIIIVIYLFYI